MNHRNWSLANNPYNFVPHDPAGLAWREPAPNLAKRQGLSGTLTCRLHTETPLIIGGERDNSATPPSIVFFRIHNQPAIPGSSLRGTIRSVFEAITNSCFSVFDGTRLHRRAYSGETTKFAAGRVIELPRGDRPGKIEKMDRAWISNSSLQEVVQVEFHKDPHAPGQGGTRSVTLAAMPAAAAPTHKCWVKLHNSPAGEAGKVKRYKGSRGRNIPIKHDLYLVEDILLQPPSPAQAGSYREGILKITGDNFPTRKRERVFVFQENPAIYSFQDVDRVDYNEILRDQLEAYEGRPGAFDLTEKNELHVGSLVYFKFDDKGKNKEAHMVSRVEVPRLFYEYSREDVLPDPALQPCTDPASLCPACRLFGFVADDKSLASRITFSDALPEKEPTMSKPNFPLRVLATPQPGSVNLYLQDPSNPDVVRDYDGTRIIKKNKVDVEDVGPVELRGRKFYKRHSAHNSQAHLERFRRPANDPTERMAGNIEAVLDGTFTFSLRFRDLEPYELGALIYTLELEENMRHALGMGKPFGFGRVKIEVSPKESVLDAENGFDDFTATRREMTSGDKEDWLAAFYTKIEEKAGKPLHALRNIQKLKTILSPIGAGDPAPKYPGDNGFEVYGNNRGKPLPRL